MTLNFHTISDKKYEFADTPLRNIIIKAGRKKIVFVEGYDDKVIFEIFYEDYLDKLHFIDTSMEQAKRIANSDITAAGGCDTVKNLLKIFVINLPDEKRFYGVIDRDLKMDEEIESEKTLPDYDGRLFIFFERYTLENYFIEADILCEFLHGKSINDKNLLPLIADKDVFKKEITDIINDILKCLSDIGAANLTIRFFDKSVKFLENSIECSEIEERLLYHRLNRFSEDKVKYKFNEFKLFIEKTNGIQKFVSVKTYFSYQFNQHMKRKNVDIQLNNHRSELARISKKFDPPDFKELLAFLLKNNNSTDKAG